MIQFSSEILFVKILTYGIGDAFVLERVFAL